MEQARREEIEANFKKHLWQESRGKEGPAEATDQPPDQPAPEKKSTAAPEKKKATIVDEENFGSVDMFKYKRAEDRLLKSVGEYHKIDEKAVKNNPKIYYTQVVEQAIKAAQLPARNAGEEGKDTVADGLILETLAKQLQRKYEDFYKQPGEQSHLTISIYSAVNSPLFADKGVVAIVECSTDPLLIQKFYLISKGYPRDIARDNPDPSRLYENYLQLGVPAIQIPLPFGGFGDDKNDLDKVRKDTLPRRICNDAVAKILKNFKQQDVSIAA